MGYMGNYQNDNDWFHIIPNFWRFFEIFILKFWWKSSQHILNQNSIQFHERTIKNGSNSSEISSKQCIFLLSCSLKKPHKKDKNGSGVAGGVAGGVFCRWWCHWWCRWWSVLFLLVECFVAAVSLVLSLVMETAESFFFTPLRDEAEMDPEEGIKWEVEEEKKEEVEKESEEEKGREIEEKEDVMVEEKEKREEKGSQKEEKEEMIVEEEKGREKEVLEEKDRLGVFCPRKQRFVFKESVLEKGEEFYEAEVKSKVDRFKGRVFVRLKNTEGGDEVWKCVLCMEVFSKTEGKKKGGKGLEGKKEEEEEEEKSTRSWFLGDCRHLY